MMMHPSYQEMISKINEGQDMDEAPLVRSRYSIVIAASKRARQIVSGDEPKVRTYAKEKPLSMAVKELYEDQVRIFPKDAPSEEELIAEAKDALLEEAQLYTEEAEEPLADEE